MLKYTNKQLNLKNILLVFCLLYCTFFFPNYAFPQNNNQLITVEAAFDKAEITIGDKVQYSISVDMEKDTDLEMPLIDPILINLGFVIKDLGEDKQIKISKNRVRKKYWYLLNTYTTAAYIVPPITLKYILSDGTEGQIETQEVFLDVKSVIKEGEELQDIRDIKQPVVIKASYKKIIIWILIILVLIICIGIGIYLLIKHKHKAPITPPLPPHVIALRDLEKAKNMLLKHKDNIKEYYISVSGVIRYYIETRFGYNAPEQTTEEFLDELTITDKLNQHHKTLLRDFLKHCDLVKFAKYGPTQEEIDGVYDTAKHFVEETIEAAQNQL